MHRKSLIIATRRYYQWNYSARNGCNSRDTGINKGYIYVTPWGWSKNVVDMRSIKEHLIVHVCQRYNYTLNHGIITFDMILVLLGKIQKFYDKCSALLLKRRIECTQEVSIYRDMCIYTPLKDGCIFPVIIWNFCYINCNWMSCYFKWNCLML